MSDSRSGAERPSAQNPLREGLRVERAAEACTIVIFGASGDLTKRKLMPGLYSLYQQNLLGGACAIVGASRTKYSHEDFRQEMKEAVAEHGHGGLGDEAQWNTFAESLFYNPTDGRSEPQSFDALAALLEKIDGERGTGGNRLFYLSTPPSLYTPIARDLARVGLNRRGRDKGAGWTRIIVEKPFGHDLESAKQLNVDLLEHFSENQVYRIDHYLGKETVQNINVLRFANGIFEPLWDRRYIDHVQITASENLGVGSRGGYYEGAGALRDMLKNHLLQVLALVAMEPPSSLDAAGVRDEKSKVLRAVRRIPADQVDDYAARGQYAKGSVNGQPVNGYRDETGVDAESNTETYAALKLYVDNWRWADVPFYLRSGKRMPKRVTEVAIQFRRVPHDLFRGQQLESNTLILRLQPDEGITLRFGAKVPGQAVQIRPVSMEFQYGTSFGKRSPEAYERLLLDAMLGDSTLFARGDFVELSWELVTPVIDYWAAHVADFPNYAAGSWGPKVSDDLVEGDDHWRRP
ncbi:MAG: glucose-6-phosphate dehydrogenase [Myxococcales bacterium]|nr:glucose-6-phosphate dehydrogenase [Myxococcales bacterium]